MEKKTEKKPRKKLIVKITELEDRKTPAANCCEMCCRCSDKSASLAL